MVTVAMLQMVTDVKEYLTALNQQDGLLPCSLAVCFGTPASTFRVACSVSAMLPTVSEVLPVLPSLFAILQHHSLPVHYHSSAAVFAYCSKTF